MLSPMREPLKVRVVLGTPDIVVAAVQFSSKSPTTIWRKYCLSKGRMKGYILPLSLGDYGLTHNMKEPAKLLSVMRSTCYIQNLKTIHPTAGELAYGNPLAVFARIIICWIMQGRKGAGEC